MSSFIHLDSEREDDGIVINVEKINAFYYRPEVEQTIIYVGGGTAECGFVVNGNKTKEICEAISVLVSLRASEQKMMNIKPMDKRYMTEFMA